MARTSIVIPTHDRPELLRRAVESAWLAGTDVEVVVVDDGSRDETSAVCASLPGIVYVRMEQRRGVGHARAAGIAASSGTYISFLDDDDVRLPGSIDRQIAVLEGAPGAGMVYGQIHRGVNGRIYPPSCPTGDVFWALIGRNFVPSGTVVVRRSTIGEVGGFHPESAPADDWDLWLRLAERHPIVALAEPVTIYREPTLWSRQGASRLADGLLAADFRVLERCAKLPRATADPRAFRRATRRLKRILCNRLLGETFEAVRHGDPYAFVSLSRAVVSTPGAFVRAMVSPSTWRKLRHAIARERAAR